MRIICIVQARTGSTRLPNKVLKKICDKTVLEHDIDRIKRVKNIDEIIIATTTLEQDDEIVRETNRLGIKCFRGSEQDVLSRYYYAAKESGAEGVVRITSDCPLIDAKISEQIIEFYINNREKYDYVSNTIDRTYPRGLDTEVFSFTALEKAFKEAKNESHREHVTPYIWSNPELFKMYQYKNNIDYSKFRWTLDTEEDLQLITAIYNYLYSEKGNGFYMEDILKLYDRYLELFQINSSIEQKEN